jgi:hypothetical protein
MQFPKLNSGAKKKPAQYLDQNPIEALTTIGSDFIDSFKNDVGKASVKDAGEQILGTENPQKNSRGGDLEPGHEISLEQAKHEIHQLTEMGHEFSQEIVHAGRKANAENSREVQIKIQEILVEIKQLANSTKDLQAQIEVISMEQTTSNADAYHVNFLEQMVRFLRDLRMDVDDSLAWFSALRSKKAARQYGTLAKKHGTSFTLSNERSAVTQTG